MKKFLAMAAAIALSMSFAACGEIDDSSSEVETSAQADVVSEAQEPTESEDESAAPEDESSEESSSKDDDSVETPAQSVGMYGYFIESVDGVEQSYVLIDDINSMIIGIGEISGIPIEASISDDDILVFRGSADDTAQPVAYTYDGSAYEFESDGHQYRWEELDFIPVSGNYYEVDSEGTYLSKLVFNGDGTGLSLDIDTDSGIATSYTQSADSIIISYGSDDDTRTYSYTYDIFRLVLTGDDGVAITYALGDS